MSDQYKYVNKSNTAVTIGAHVLTAAGSLTFTSTQADLDLQDGILVDAYINGVPKVTEFTPAKLTGPIGIGTDATATAMLSLPAGTTAVASLNITPGVAPTTPVDGDIWGTTAALFIRVAGVTKTIAFTA